MIRIMLMVLPKTSTNDQLDRQYRDSRCNQSLLVSLCFCQAHAIDVFGSNRGDDMPLMQGSN